MTTQAVFAALLALLPMRAPDDFVRYGTIAQAIAYATDDPVTRAALVVMVKKESNGDQRVHSGELRGRAGEVGLTQIHPVAERFVERMGYTLDGLTGHGIVETTAAMTVAARLLSGYRAKCWREHYRTNWAEAMFTAYHYGGRCWLSPHAKARARLLRSVMSGEKGRKR